jgi:hypothetical protein
LRASLRRSWLLRASWPQHVAPATHQRWLVGRNKKFSVVRSNVHKNKFYGQDIQPYKKGLMISLIGISILPGGTLEAAIANCKQMKKEPLDRRRQ